ncbi:prostaglandin E2 receptor EP4 subtype-like [Haliotis rufescens]|uniref:prostaglandin E2 receptor EP4 subtype-like n=1 Tax=Haliotis rufescens TaxID=6454 RepID=UPI001EB024AB|nr:prostaglandin E2 receptor EP4 subtype-like [Haliotis rufescens]XP_046334194.1 prostaglandin E2 receptor EP4 subtype-like [Haliotis rufescens]XP_046334195.1 prostaglandin E2 receptor EP4 subtype-like [Haliotis rufescens]XP_046334197.1 prostaglandin E2 receptor EP4 subtype-like [Haliotis rufescens]XP_046334198.1 prostaglandin E2 receptor EP4 subtype-like [Haliotis rufescens]
MNTSEFPFSTLSPEGKNMTPNDTSEAKYAIGATIMSPIIMSLAGVVGNVLALVVLQKTKTEIRRMMFYTLVAALACTDLAGILLTTPVTVAAYMNRREMPGGKGLCKFNAFIMVCFGLATPLIVCAMAVERFLAIKCTYFYSKHCTPQNARITVVVLWAFVFFFGALPLFGFGDYTLQYPHTWCFLNFRTDDLVFAIYGYLYAGVNLGIVVLMTCCNVFVMITLLRVRYIKQQQGRNSISSSLLHDSFDDSRRMQTQMKRNKQNDVEMQMIWLMCAITTIFAVCWAPLMIHIVITLATKQSNPVLGLTAVRLASLNQTLDPWLYILLRKAFLKKIRDTAKKFVCSKSTSSKDVPECRCNQYVHVRRQLCHRNYFVGNTEPSDPAARQSCDEARVRSNAQEFQHGAGALPDVMRTASSNNSDHLPDVTRSKVAAGGIPELNGAYDSSSNSQRHQSDSPDGIYVDIFRLLPPVAASSNIDSDDAIESTSRASNTPDANLNPDSDSDVFEPEECSSSGIFSLTQSVPNDLISEKVLHSDITPVKSPQNRQKARRTKSYT